jgi:hypothetical protein
LTSKLPSIRIWHQKIESETQVCRAWAGEKDIGLIVFQGCKRAWFWRSFIKAFSQHHGAAYLSWSRLFWERGYIDRPA